MSRITVALRTIYETAAKLLKFGVPSYILSFGESLGDNLLLTTLAAELQRRGRTRIWVRCDHESLFVGNPDISHVLPYKALLSVHLLRLFGVRVVTPQYTSYDAETDQDAIPDKHIVLKMADSLGLKGSIPNQPVVCLSRTELNSCPKELPLVVVVTSSVSALIPMRNKEWLPERYQDVVDALRSRYHIIQLGSPGDYPLTHVEDLRGRTTVRQTAVILKNASLMISHVGFMMHLARAVNCRSVIIYGGRETPAQSGYSSFENIYSAVPCSPCWLHNRCDFEKRCMTSIGAGKVLAAAERQLALSGQPLTPDILQND